MSTIASQLPLNTSETARDRGLVPKDHQYEMAYGESNGHESRDWWRHVTPKGHVVTQYD